MKKLPVIRGRYELRFEDHKSMPDVWRDGQLLLSSVCAAEAARYGFTATEVERGYDPVNLTSLSLGLVRAQGPVAFSEIFAECETQCPYRFEDIDVVAALNGLLRAGAIELYDTGDSFVLGKEGN